MIFELNIGVVFRVAVRRPYGDKMAPNQSAQAVKTLSDASKARL
jgi:hypothetical protein